MYKIIPKILKQYGFTCISYDESSKDTIYVHKDGTTVVINKP